MYDCSPGVSRLPMLMQRKLVLSAHYSSFIVVFNVFLHFYVIFVLCVCVLSLFKSKRAKKATYNAVYI